MLLPAITSNSIVMNVTQSVSPSVTISTARTIICPGTIISFIATPANGGTPAGYQWKKNDIPVGTDANRYTDSNTINGDVINCTITFNNKCLVDPFATSNNIAITVFKNPVVDLDETNTLCSGTGRLLDAGNYPP